jgi:hypothetical protein
MDYLGRPAFSEANQASGARTQDRKGAGAMRGFWLALLAVSIVNPARADWLADAWSNHESGTPAIIFSRTGVVTVVLPEELVAQARATGLSTEGAVSAFLGRYAPPICSGLIDMNLPHANLKVDFLLEHPVALKDADAATQEDAAEALNRALKSPPTGSIPRIQRVFVVDPKPLSLSIGYAPDHQVHCVEPPVANF